jgi:hypothetical protein
MQINLLDEPMNLKDNGSLWRHKRTVLDARLLDPIRTSGVGEWRMFTPLGLFPKLQSSA